MPSSIPSMDALSLSPESANTFSGSSISTSPSFISSRSSLSSCVSAAAVL